MDLSKVACWLCDMEFEYFEGEIFVDHKIIDGQYTTVESVECPNCGATNDI